MQKLLTLFFFLLSVACLGQTELGWSVEKIKDTYKDAKYQLVDHLKEASTIKVTTEQAYMYYFMDKNECIFVMIAPKKKEDMEKMAETYNTTLKPQVKSEVWEKVEGGKTYVIHKQFDETIGNCFVWTIRI